MSEHQPPADPYQPHEPSGFESPVPPAPAPSFPESAPSFPAPPPSFPAPAPLFPAQNVPAQASPTGPAEDSPTYPVPAYGSAPGQPYPPTEPIAAPGWPQQPGQPQQTAQFPGPAYGSAPGQPGQPGQPGYPTSGVPQQTGFPTSGVPQQTGYPQPPYFPPQPGYPAPPATPAPGKRRGLLITSIILGVVVLLCAGGGVTGFLLTRNLDGKGQATPVEAVTGFLSAVYDQKNATRAGTYVCGAARDSKAITRKINEARQVEQKYPQAQFRWSTPVVAQQKATSAIVSTKLRLLTTDERVAEQNLKFTVVKKSGWLVCEVQQQKS